MRARACRMAKLEPMQPWRPPPKPMKEKGAALSSSRGGRKRPGSKSSGRGKTCGRRCENAGDVATTCPCSRAGSSRGWLCRPGVPHGMHVHQVCTVAHAGGAHRAARACTDMLRHSVESRASGRQLPITSGGPWG